MRSLSSDVFERRMSTGSEPFSLLIYLDAIKFVSLCVLTLIETLPKNCSKSQARSAKSSLPVDVRRSKTSLFILPIMRQVNWDIESEVSQPSKPSAGRSPFSFYPPRFSLIPIFPALFPNTRMTVSRTFKNLNSWNIILGMIWCHLSLWLVIKVLTSAKDLRRFSTLTVKYRVIVRDHIFISNKPAEIKRDQFSSDGCFLVSRAWGTRDS